jgi:putative phosphoesterase
MRIAIVSDIHGNLVAFEAVLKHIRRQAPDLALHGGDLATTGPRPAEVVDRIRELGWPGVRGNTDELPWSRETEAAVRRSAPKLGPWLDLLFGQLGPWASEQLGDERTSWLRRLPERQSEGDLRLVHASPGNLWQAPAPDASGQELTQTYRSLSGPLIAYGHIHRPFIARSGDLTVANSGSVGMPFDGDPRASYLLIDDGRPVVQRVEYDREAARRDLVETKFPAASVLAEVYASGSFRLPTY